MLSEYLPYCALNAPFYGTSSLNLPANPIHAEQGYIEIIETIPDPRDNAEAFTEKQSCNRYIRQFVLDLPYRQRQIAYAFYWLDWSQKKIADYLDISPSAVSQSLQKIHEFGRSKLTFN